MTKMLSALLIHGVPIECIHRAAIVYNVPVKIIVSVIETEGGEVGSANKNSNGSIDYGVMQINSVWLPQIAPYGYTEKILQYDNCANVTVGTWILSQKLHASPNFWQGVGNYHSYTEKNNQIYQSNVSNKLENIDKVTSILNISK